MPKVSVLMPSFNYAQYLPLAAESVLSQSFGDLELIIVDDCSTDGSKDIAHELGRLDDRVVTVLHSKNRGLAAARNSGFAASSGDYIALCDSDDVWMRNKLEVQLEHFHRSPSLGLVYSESSIIDSSGRLTGQVFSSLSPSKDGRMSGALFESLCRTNFICVPTVVLRKEALRCVGGFAEDLRSLEDWVCWMKIARSYHFYYIQQSLAYYRVHRASLSNNRAGMAQNRVKAIQMILDLFSDIPPQSRARLLYALGMGHLESNDPRAALKVFADLVKDNPVHVRSWARYCQSIVAIGREIAATPTTNPTTLDSAS